MSWPARSASGPCWPQPVMRANTSFGLSASRTSGPSPSRSMTFGRNPSTTTSARLASSRAAATPSAVFRSSIRERRPRIMMSYQRSRPNPSRGSLGRSTSSTSAPMSASIMQPKGTGPMASNSSTRSPARGPMRAIISTAPAGLHAAPVLAAHPEERLRDLTERADAHRVHQHGEDVAVVDDRLLKALQQARRVGCVARMEVVEALELRFLLVLGRARELEALRHRIAMRVAEGVDADDRVLAGVLEHLVVEAFLLDLAALVAGFHRTEHAAALGDALELREHGFFHELGQLVDDERTLVRVLVLREAPLAVDDQL